MICAVAHLGLQKGLDVLELHIWVYVHREVLAIGDERDLHGLGPYERRSSLIVVDNRMGPRRARGEGQSQSIT